MRVLCIDNKNPLNLKKLAKSDWVYEGDMYTVVDEVVNEFGHFYLLAERLGKVPPVLYAASRFVALSTNTNIQQSKYSLENTESTC